MKKFLINIGVIFFIGVIVGIMDEYFPDALYSPFIFVYLLIAYFIGYYLRGRI